MKVYIISLDEDYGDNEALVAVCETLDQANRWLDWLGGDSSNWKAEINQHINVYDLDLGALPTLRRNRAVATDEWQAAGCASWDSGGHGDDGWCVCGVCDGGC